MAVASKALRCAAGQARRAGFTLVEVLAASLILAVIVAALTQAVLAGQMHTHDALHQSRAAALAEATLERVLRVAYADVDAYDGFSQSAGAIVDVTGEAYPAAYQVFSRTVSVQPETLGMAALGPQAGRRITVTVEDERGRTWRLTRFAAE
ncbi:MAG: prepilin-type N-terminal cleavage/methylation domain-containing protein [Phycisphaeraceae bacterium]